MNIIQALQAIIDNPDDLTNLPKIIAQVQNLENSELANQERIMKLQEYNRAYLAQIPIDNLDPANQKKEEKKEEVPATYEDAQAYIREFLSKKEEK